MKKEREVKNKGLFELCGDGGEVVLNPKFN